MAFGEGNEWDQNIKDDYVVSEMSYFLWRCLKPWQWMRPVRVGMKEGLRLSGETR